MFFLAYVKNDPDGEKGMAVRIPKETGQSPGDRIKSLTQTARKLPLTGNEKLRTDILVNPPSAFETISLSEYLWADGTLNDDRYLRHLESFKNGKNPHRFLPRVGITVVMEEDLIGRKGVLDVLYHNLSNQKSSHLRAARRYGKSSLMARLEAQFLNTVMMEVSDVGNLAGFLKRLIDRCLRKKSAAACLHELPEYTSFPDASTNRINPQVLNNVFSELIKDYKGISAILGLLGRTLSALADVGIFLLIDEFSAFLREMKENDVTALTAFLKLFHQFRTREKNPVVVVLAGSSGLSTYIELFGMRDWFEDLVAVDIPPISSSEAELLAEELFYGMNKAPFPSAVKKLAALTGADETIPYFVHALAHYSTEQAGFKREISEEDVEAAYYDRLLGPSGNPCFRDFILREKGYPGDYRKGASKILKELSRVSPGMLPEEELHDYCRGDCDFKKLMTCLEEDYDLVQDKSGWRMRSRVIADRWRLGEPWLTIGGKP